MTNCVPRGLLIRPPWVHSNRIYLLQSICLALSSPSKWIRPLQFSPSSIVYRIYAYMVSFFAGSWGVPLFLLNCLYGILSRLADLVVAFLQHKVMRLACGTQIFERYNMESICIHEYYKKNFFFFGQNITKNSFYRDVYPACHTWINHIQNHG